MIIYKFVNEGSYIPITSELVVYNTEKNNVSYKVTSFSDATDEDNSEVIKEWVATVSPEVIELIKDQISKHKRFFDMSDIPGPLITDCNNYYVTAYNGTKKHTVSAYAPWAFTDEDIAFHGEQEVSDARLLVSLVDSIASILRDAGVLPEDDDNKE